MGGQMQRAWRASAHGCSVVASGFGSSKMRKRRSSDPDARASGVSVSDDEAEQVSADTPAIRYLESCTAGTPDRTRHNDVDPEDCPTGRSQSTGAPSTPEAFTGTSTSSNSSPTTVTHDAAASPPSPPLAHAVASEDPHHPDAPWDTVAGSTFSLGQQIGSGTTIMSPIYVGTRPVGVSTPRVPASSLREGVGDAAAGPGSWLANRLDQESTANDEAIARALAEQLAQEASAPSSPSRSRTSEPSPHRERNRERNQVYARDEALAIALALGEEEVTGLAQLRRQRPRIGPTGPGLVMPLPRTPFPLHIDERDASPVSARGGGREREREREREGERGEGEKCIACEDNVVNCCLIPCGHVILCIPCARRVIPRKCPVCRLQFEQVVRTSRRTRNV